MSKDFHFFPPSEPINVQGALDPQQPVIIQPDSYSVIPVEAFGYRTMYLRNPLDDSESQLVDGSVTPVEFLSNPATVRTLVWRATTIVTSINSNSILDYGNIVGGLTNGVDIFVRRPGPIDSNFFNIKRFIEYDHISNIQVGSIRVSGNTSETTFSAKLSFLNPLVLDIGSSLGVRINDNLTGLLYQSATLLFSEIP